MEELVNLLVKATAQVQKASRKNASGYIKQIKDQNRTDTDVGLLKRRKEGLPLDWMRSNVWEIG